MARIPSGEGLGEVVARPQRFNETQTPRAAFGSQLADTVEGIGTDMRRTEILEQQQAQAAREAADRASANAALFKARDELDDMGLDFDERIQTGSIDKTKAGEEWTSAANERISGVLETVPAAHRASVQAELDARAGRLQRGLRRSVTRRDQQDVRSAIDQTREYAERLYLTDPVTADQLMDATLSSVGPHSGLAPDQLQKVGQAYRETSRFTAADRLVNGARASNAQLAEVEKALEGERFADLDPQRRGVLLTRIEGFRAANVQRAEMAAQRAERLRDRAMKHAEAEFNTFQALADKGTVLDPAYVERVTQATAGTPYQAGIKQLAQQAVATGGLAGQSLPTQRAVLDDIDRQIATQGRSPELDKRRSQIEKVVRGSEQDAKADPLRAYLERSDESPNFRPIDTSSVQNLVQSLQARAPIVANASAWAGTPVSPLTAEEIEPVRQVLDVLPDREKAVAVSMLANTLGRGTAAGLARQIDKTDKPLALAFAAAGPGLDDRNRVAAILRGAKAIKDGTASKDPAKLTGWNAQIAREMDGLLLNPQKAKDVQEAAGYILGALAFDRGGTASGSMATKAVEMALGGTIVEQGKGRVVLPTGLTHAQLTQRLRAVTPEELAPQVGGSVVRAAGAEVPVDQFVKSLPGATLSTVGPGRYVVLVDGRAVTSADGARPIVIGVQ